MDYIMNTKMDMHTSWKYITTVLNTFVPLDNDLREQLPIKVIFFLLDSQLRHYINISIMFFIAILFTWCIFLSNLCIQLTLKDKEESASLLSLK